ncbi:hypothetical protein [Micropruina sonneratiae]|nr:hypothetical protein [Micropruina sp. KQZ13P-5]MCW3156517.1 hypothetical protein [Micropruina sp. KQZ13P-5]
MAEILNLQDEQTPEVPGDEKASNNSYFICHNSHTSNFLCWRP